MPVISFKGILAEGLEDKIHLATLNGLKGYRIVKFNIISQAPGDGNKESVVKIYSKSQGAGGTTVDFTESDLLAVAYFSDRGSDTGGGLYESKIIFDNEVFNQDIFITLGSPVGTTPVNYYIELETIKLSATQATQLTLKNLRQIASR